MITGDPLYSKSTIIELGLVTNYIYIYTGYQRWRGEKRWNPKIRCAAWGKVT